MTKQHIFPNRLNSILTEQAQDHLEAVGHFHTFTPQTASPAPSIRIRQGPVGKHQLRRVCKECNEGWMEDVENEANAFLVPLMNGEDLVLNQDAQRKLAAWICLVPMVDELRDLAGAAIPHSDRHWLREHREPPPGWRIWIAKYAGQRWDAHRLHRIGMLVGTSAPDVDDHRFNCNTQVTTFVLRQFCAHAFSSTVWPDFQGYEGVTLHQIWPYAAEQIAWATASRLNDGSVVSLSESLARDLRPFP